MLHYALFIITSLLILPSSIHTMDQREKSILDAIKKISNTKDLRSLNKLIPDLQQNPDTSFLVRIALNKKKKLKEKTIYDALNTLGNTNDLMSLDKLISDLSKNPNTVFLVEIALKRKENLRKRNSTSSSK